MNEAQHRLAVVVLAKAIQIAISAPRSVATNLESALREVGQSPGHHSAASAPSVASESVDWDVVSQGGGQPALGQGGYAEIEASITQAPPACLELCAALTDSHLRAQRAWEAGLWARAIADGRVPTPRATPKINLQSRVYVVLRAPGLASPTRVASYSDYRRILPEFEDSISHAFASLAEARVYCAAFGTSLPSEKRWSQ